MPSVPGWSCSMPGSWFSFPGQRGLAPRSFLLHSNYFNMFCLPHFSSFGVGGSRRPSAFSLGAAWELLTVWHRAGVEPGSVFTSCGAGAPALAAAMFPGCRFFSAAELSGLGAAAFPVRAAALVRALAAAPAPLWVCFPEEVCPPAARPCRRWVSCGSGSWSECALAFGLGVPVLVFLPRRVAPPSWSSARWSEVAWRPGGRWWYLPVSGVLF